MQVFVSYSVENGGAGVVKRFCDGLDEALQRAGCGPARHVQHDETLRVGDDWQDKLVGRLDEADVLVPLYSPQYFNSEPCGKELGLFLERHPAVGPLRVVPVWWDPSIKLDDRKYPVPLQSGDERLDGLQHRTRSQEAEGQITLESLARKGLRYYVDNATLDTHRPLLDTYFKDLAETIRQIAGDGQTLAPCQSNWSQAPDVWASARAAAIAAPPAGAPRPAPSGPFVRFIVMAAQPGEIGKLNTDDPELPDSYLQFGGREWKPFKLPEPTRIDALLQRFVILNSSDMTVAVEVESVTDVQQAVQHVADSKAAGMPLFFIVDAWSAQLPRYRSILQELAERAMPFCAVIVPFARQAERPEVEAAVHRLLDTREQLQDELCITYVASTPAELERHVASLSEKIRQKFRNLRSRQSGAGLQTPFTNGPKPRLTGPGSPPP